MESYLVSQALWDITYMKDTTPLEEATTRAKWIAKVSRALFAIIEISMDDNMLDHIMDVWYFCKHIFQEAKIQGWQGVCYQCGKRGHVACDCKVRMVVIEGNSTIEVNFTTIVKICEYVLTLEI